VKEDIGTKDEYGKKENNVKDCFLFIDIPRVNKLYFKGFIVPALVGVTISIHYARSPIVEKIT
jgi:hypothetical protein